MRTALARLLAGLSLALWLAACDQDPGADDIRAMVQQRLDGQFQDGLFEITAFRRQGSAPETPGPDGAPRRIVYFNATLTFRAAHDFAAWEGRNLALLARLLGAGQTGIVNPKSGAYAAGDILQVRGSLFLAAPDGRWQPVAGRAPEAAAGVPADGPGAPSPMRAAAERIEQAFERRWVSLTAADREAVRDELAAAYLNIELRLDRRRGVLPIVTGPPGGSYHAVGRGAERATAGRQRPLHNFATDGSAQNLDLVQRGLAVLGISQSDVAGQAFRGQGPFAPRGPMPDIRALASLFPEPVQVVVAAGSPIETVGELAGKRVELGLPRSGMRLTGLAVLAAHGIDPKALLEIQSLGLADAGQRLRDGTVDAVIATIAAPARALQNLGSDVAVRFLSLDAEAIARLTSDSTALVRHTLPAFTYAQQPTPVRTVAATAVLMTHRDTPNAAAEEVLQGVFGSVGLIAQDSLQAAFISEATARRGITIPLHPGALRYYQRRR